LVGRTEGSLEWPQGPELRPDNCDSLITEALFRLAEGGRDNLEQTTEKGRERQSEWTEEQTDGSPEGLTNAQL